MNPLDVAMEYAARGIHVLPLRPASKEPWLTGWPDRASADRAVIRTWDKRYLGANLGILTGSRSGMVVIDIDVKNGIDGMASWNRLCEQHGSAPETWTARTPSGGTHLYFGIPSGLAIGNSVGTLAPGIDVKGDRGQVVAPPSTLGEGLQYRWARGPETEIAATPEWLVELLTVPPGQGTAKGPRRGWRPKRQSAYHTWRMRSIPEGQRNDTLHSMAGALRRYGCLEPMALDILQYWNEAACLPPLDGAEVERITASAMNLVEEENFSTATETGRALLLTRLHDGPVAAGQALRLGERHGVSSRRMKDAKNYYGDLVIARRIGTPGGLRGHGRWEWDLAFR